MRIRGFRSKGFGWCINAMESARFRAVVFEKRHVKTVFEIGRQGFVSEERKNP